MDRELLGVGRTFIFAVLCLLSTIAMVFTGKMTLTVDQWIMLVGVLTAIYAGKSVGKKLANGKKQAAANGNGELPGRRTYGGGATFALMLVLLLLPALLWAPSWAETVPVTIQAGGFWQTGQTTTFAKGVSLGVDGVVGGVGVDLIGLQTERHDEEFWFAKGFVEYKFSLLPGWYVGLAPLGSWWRITTEDGKGDEIYSAYAVATGYHWNLLTVDFAAEVRGEFVDVAGPGDMYFAGLSLSGYIK